MRRYIFCSLAALVLLMSSCNPFSVAYSGEDVEIEIQIKEVSAGFMDVKFMPNLPAYYLCGIEKAVEGVEPEDVAQRFMDLALDSAYVEYVIWRHDYLMKNEQYVADFASHSLNYCDYEEVEDFLSPDTDYWVYAFPVDRDSNKANGRLFYKKVRTLKTSKFSNVRYAYRVRGEWDYVYPYIPKENVDPNAGSDFMDINARGTLVTNVSWAGLTADSLALRAAGYNYPGEYFDEKLYSLDWRSPLIHRGVYSHWNNGMGDGSSSTRFELGHTYYTAMATLDGPRSESFDIYRFTYTGEDMELMFYDESSTKGAW